MMMIMMMLVIVSGDDDDNATDDGGAHLLTSALTSRSITSRTDSSPLETMMMIFVMITVIKMNDADGDIHSYKKKLMMMMIFI